MSYQEEKMMPPASLADNAKIPAAVSATIRQHRQEIKDILDRKDQRLIAIVGPCSIHNVPAADSVCSSFRERNPSGSGRESSRIFLLCEKLWNRQKRTGDCQMNPAVLEELRSGIDSVDKKIVELFRKRMECASRIAEYKRSGNLPVLDTKREETVLARIAETAGSDLAEDAVKLFRSLFEISRDRQKRIMKK